MAYKMTDDKLIEEIKSGSENAFGALAMRYQPRIRARIRKLVREDDVEDVIQDVHLRVVRTIGAFRGDSSFATWLVSVTNHAIAEYYRRRERRMRPGNLCFVPDEVYDPWIEVEQHLALEEVLKSTNSLTSKQKQAIELRLQDKSFVEIAQELGIGYEAARNRYRWGIYICRRLLE